MWFEVLHICIAYCSFMLIKFMPSLSQDKSTPNDFIDAYLEVYRCMLVYSLQPLSLHVKSHQFMSMMINYKFIYWFYAKFKDLGLLGKSLGVVLCKPD